MPDKLFAVLALPDTKYLPQDRWKWTKFKLSTWPACKMAHARQIICCVDPTRHPDIHPLGLLEQLVWLRHYRYYIKQNITE